MRNLWLALASTVGLCLGGVSLGACAEEEGPECRRSSECGDPDLICLDNRCIETPFGPNNVVPGGGGGTGGPDDGGDATTGEADAAPDAGGTEPDVDEGPAPGFCEHFSFFPSPMNLGSSSGTSGLSRTGRITNRGSSSLTISSITVLGGRGWEVGPPDREALPIVLRPGASLSVTVGLAPTSGSSSGILEIVGFPCGGDVPIQGTTR